MKKRISVSLLHGRTASITSFALIYAFCAARAADDFRVRPQGDDIELSTPYGVKTVTGSFPLTRGGNYRIEVPISDLYAKPLNLPPHLRGPAGNPLQEPPPSPPAAPAAPSAAAIPPVDGYWPHPREDVDRLVLEANHLYNQGRFYEATLVVDMLLRKSPNYVRGWIMKGSLMYVQGQKDLARKAWEQAKTLAPEDEEVQDILEKYR